MFVSENDYIKLMNNLNTQNPNNYIYKTKDLEIHILGGLQINKMESLRVTLSIEKAHLSATSSQREEKKESRTVLNILRQSLDLYNDTTVEKFIRKCAERLEIGTNLTRRTLQELTKALENYRFAIIDKSSQAQKPKTKQLTKTKKDQAIKSNFTRF